MKAFLRFFLVAVGTATFASCTENGSMIYQNIQGTTKTTTSATIPTDITVADIVTEGADNAAHPYYVAAGKVYNGSIPSGGSITWSAIAVPKSSGADMLCNVLAYDGTNKRRWGGFFSSDGSAFGLYSTPAGSDFSASAAVVDSVIAGKQITYLKAMNGDLFAVTSTMSNGSPVYDLAVLPTGSTSWSLLFSALPKSITGIGFHSGTYFVSSGANLYTASGTSPIGSNPAAWTLGGGVITASDGSTSSGGILRGVFVDEAYTNGSIVMVPASNQGTSSQTGNLYYSTNGGTRWARLSTQASGYNVGFLCVAGPVDSGHTIYLLGTDAGTGGAFGFYSVTPGSGTLSRFSGSSYSLYYDVVRAILVDRTNNLLALGTLNDGLWITTSIDSSGSFSGNSWYHE